MDTMQFLRLRPTMPMIVEAFQEAGWECYDEMRDEEQSYRSIRLYHGQKDLQPDVLYLLRPTEKGFPTGEFSYISAAPIAGAANHFSCPGQPDEKILDFVLELFALYQEREQMIDQLIYRNASLQELCDLGSRLLENPVCIHDDWFIMTAMSQDVSQVMEPEYLMSSARGFVPQAIVEDFKYDSDYLETYEHRDAQIWSMPGKPRNSLYVNLWDGAVYRGRLLVLRQNRDFRRSDFPLAEVLTQRAMLLLRSKRRGEEKIFQNMDDMIFSLLQGDPSDPADQVQLMRMLGWDRGDPLVCIRLQNQQPDGASVMEHLLHSDLFHAFPGSYIMLNGREQSMILNLAQEKTVLPALISHRLAPLCRDYCLYAGISSPVNGIQELYIAYRQAGAALERAFQLRSEKWIIPFSDCALEYLLESLQAPLQQTHLVAPELYLLIDYDREKGTQYFETFREYLLNERDIPRTAEKLIIHRTTLLYRLKKIQSLLNVDLEDPWKRLYLTISLWILEREDSLQNQ